MKYINLNQLPIKSVSHNLNIQKKTIIEKDNIPHLTNFSQAIFKSGQIATNHSHKDMWEVFFVESGRGIIKINGEEFLLEKGLYVIVEPKENHEIINNSQEDLIINYFGIAS
ncbi:cupin domain-containing protein [Geminocystis sp. CENA526]|uniref:cupin domain-containing protein n=1 Tax=Geminocystis sp. CENA526 TaxID=1355871 RepID=UPI003D6F5253